VIYLDSSAIVKMIRPEAESRDLVEWLNRRNEPAVTSVLAEVEVPRALPRSWSPQERR
jgi:predicted nucleic acid-binding protein